MQKHAENHFWNSIKNIVGIFVYCFCQWLTLILVIHIAGYTVSGEFSLVISFTNLFCVISQYNIRSYQLSDVNGKFLPKQYSGAYIITSGLAVVFFLIVLLFIGYSSSMVLLCVVYMLFKLCETFTNYIFTYMQLEYRYSDIAISYCLKGIIPLIGFAVCLYFTQSLFQTLCILSLLYAAVIIFYDIRKTYSFFPRGIVMKGTIHLLKECFPMMLASLIYYFLFFIPRFAVENVYGSTELGYYSAFAMVITVLSTMATAVCQVIIPVLSEKYVKRLTGDIVRIIFTILGIIVVAAFAMILLARLIGDRVFSIVFGAEILGHMYLLPPVIFASVMLTVMNFSGACLTAMHKRVPMLIGMLVGAMLLGVMVIPVTRTGGMLGTTNIFTAALCVIILIYVIIIIKNLA